MEGKLPLIGRERKMIDDLTKEIRNANWDSDHSYEVTPIYRRTRGSSFEVLMEDGRVAKVTVELDRVEN